MQDLSDTWKAAARATTGLTWPLLAATELMTWWKCHKTFFFFVVNVSDKKAGVFVPEKFFSGRSNICVEGPRGLHSGKFLLPYPETLQQEKKCQW
jgi:hypothetical protein